MTQTTDAGRVTKTRSGTGRQPEVARRLTALIALSAEGDDEAFSELYGLTAVRIHGVVMRVLCSHDHATEVTQEVYLEVWQNADRYTPDKASVTTWMTTLAQRRAIDRVRAVTHEHKRDIRYGIGMVELPAEDVADDVAEHMDAEAARAKVHEALSVLTVSQREVISLMYFGGHSQSEVARLLGLPIGTVKYHARQGMTKMRKVLDSS